MAEEKIGFETAVLTPEIRAEIVDLLATGAEHLKIPDHKFLVLVDQVLAEYFELAGIQFTPVISTPEKGG